MSLLFLPQVSNDFFFKKSLVRKLTSPLSSFIPMIGSGLLGCSFFALFAFRPKSLSVVAPLIAESAMPEFCCFSARPLATPSTSGSVMSFLAARLTAWSSVEEPFQSWNLWPLTPEERDERGSEVDCCCWDWSELLENWARTL